MTYLLYMLFFVCTQFAGDTVFAITNIVTFSSGRQHHGDYLKCFLFWERIFEQKVDTRHRYNYGVITAKNKRKWIERQRRCLVPLIRRRMIQHIDVKIDGALPYIEKLFNHFCDRKHTVNLSCIRDEIQFMDEALRDILFKGPNGHQEVNMENLFVIFPNVRGYVAENGNTVKYTPQTAGK